MKTIIAGSRTITDMEILKEAIQNSGFNITEVVSGHANGVDKLGEQWAKENIIPLVIVPAQWEKFGKSAGYRRNIEMAEHADALIALWDGKSRGTKHMIDIAKNKRLQVYYYIAKQTPIEPSKIKKGQKRKKLKKEKLPAQL